MRQFDEMYIQEAAPGSPVRAHYQAYAHWLSGQSEAMMLAHREEAEMIFRRVGITFAVYGDKDENGSGTERLIPFDLIPRIIPAHEWQSMERGLVQRVTALNRFVHDVYPKQEIIHAGLVPAEQITGNTQFRAEMMGIDVPHQIYSHISGVDIVRAGAGEFHRAIKHSPGISGNIANEGIEACKRNPHGTDSLDGNAAVRRQCQPAWRAFIRGAVTASSS
ncbi:circularly permuted type 2 ATP-grasp protein, partial [bacterium]|nr:circularly permuted type 2 ATP-grasp protein [bacterium]